MFLLTLFECGSSARETRNVSVWWQNILDCVSDFSYTRRACESARHESRPAHSGQIGIRPIAGLVEASLQNPELSWRSPRERQLSSSQPFSCKRRPQCAVIQSTCYELNSCLRPYCMGHRQNLLRNKGEERRPMGMRLERTGACGPSRLACERAESHERCQRRCRATGADGGNTPVRQFRRL